MKAPQFKESVDTFTVNFGSNNNSHSIQAELFTKVINSTIELIKLSANAIDPNSFLKLEIKANKEGSFETIIDAIAKYTSSILTPDNARLACEVVGGYLAFLKIKEHLKDKKAKKIKTKDNETTITNQDNIIEKYPSNIANKFLNNSKIDTCIVNIFNGLEENNKPNFNVDHNDQKLSFTKDKYDYMQKKL